MSGALTVRLARAIRTSDRLHPVADRARPVAGRPRLRRDPDPSSSSTATSRSSAARRGARDPGQTAGADPGAIECRPSCPTRSPSRVRSSTRRPATSGSRTRRRRIELTSSGGDSMPVVVTGRRVHLLHRDHGPGDRTGRIEAGPVQHYFLQVPDLMRVRADGTTPPERIVTGKFKQGKYAWSFWMREPVMSPTDRRSPWSPTPPTPRTATSSSVPERRDREDHPGGRAGGRHPRTPGSGMATGRQAPPICPERSGRDPRGPDHRPL